MNMKCSFLKRNMVLGRNMVLEKTNLVRDGCQSSAFDHRIKQ